MPKKFKPGEFVRRCLTSGIPVGGVCVIDDVEKAGLYVHHLPLDRIGSFYIRRDEVVKLKVARLSISNKDAMFIAKKRPYAFTRSITPTWQTAIKEKQFDIIVLTAPNKYKFVVKNSTVWPYLNNDVAIRWETYLKVDTK